MSSTMSDILPQLIEFSTQLDLQRLIVLQTTLCLLAALRTVPVYNLPLLFFGVYSYQHHESSEPLQLFTGFTAFSMLLDIIWLLLTNGIGFGEGLTIVVLFLKPITVISALQLLKQRDHGDPFASFGGGLNWTNRSHGYEGGLGAYQTIGDGDYERDAEEISIPRHFPGQMHGRHRNSQQSGSFMTTSSRSGSVKSSRTGSGYNVELGTNSTGGGYHGSSHNYGSPVTTGAVSVSGSNITKDDRKDKVGMNISDDEEDGSDNRDASSFGGAEVTRENK